MRAVLFVIASIIPAHVLAQDIGSSSGALIGDVSLGEQCTPEQSEAVAKGVFLGRTASATDAFTECIQDRIAQDYSGCQGDPFNSDSRAIQTERTLDAARSPNALAIECSGGFGNASAGIGDYEGRDAESFAFAGWLASSVDQIALPNICTGPERGRSDQAAICRWDADPWPYSQIAGIVWHEAMHQRGYGHGANESSGAQAACAPVDANGSPPMGWDYQVNTVPYIVEQCLVEVINQGVKACGDLYACPHPNMLNLPTSRGGTSCNCVFDPQASFEVLALRNGRLEPDDVVRDLVGQWRVGPSDRHLSTGNFLPDAAQILTKSAWGIGVLETMPWGRIAVLTPFGTRLGSWTLKQDDVFDSADVDGDGFDDLIVMNGGQLAIITTNSMQFSLHDSLALTGAHRRFPRFISNGMIAAIGDFDGIRGDDVLLEGDDVLLVAAFRAGRLEDVGVNETGDAAGEWRLNVESDNIIGAADLDGDGVDSLIVSSPWGLGVLDLVGGGFRSSSMFAEGTMISGSQVALPPDLPPGDVIIADLDGDGADDLLLRTEGGLIAVRVSNGSMEVIAEKEVGDWIGPWRLDSTTQGVWPVGDVTPRRGEDLVLSSEWGLALIEVDSGQFRAVVTHRNREAMNGWLPQSQGMFLPLTHKSGNRILHSMRQVVQVRR